MLRWRMADESILVIDDSPTILKLVELVLTKAGYRVATASGGETGLVAAKEEAPQLILLDYLMPDMNGDDVCRVMSGDTALADVPVVVMSARHDEVGERFARMTNVVDYITKPFSPEALATVIGHYVEKYARKRRGHAPPSEQELRILSVSVDHAAARPEGRGALTEAAAAPALAGDLAVISIADVLTMLQDQAQTGYLALAHGPAQIEVFLAGGRIDFATARGVPEEFLLGRFLVEAGQITAAALAAVIEQRRSHRAGDPQALVLGADLLGRGLVTAAGLRKVMSLQTTALVYEGLAWGSGRFQFHVLAELPPLARDAALALPVDGLVMEGLRRVDEWRLIEREVGDFDSVFVRNDDRVAAFGRGKLLRDEVTVLDLVNGRNAVKDIVSQTKMGSFDVMKMLYRLLRNKLVRRRVPPVAV